jgi:hypothetical protein
MAPDFLDQLADMEVPPPPAEFGQELHQRMNRGLVIVQLVELVAIVFPTAVLELGRALGGLVRFTASGKYDLSKKKQW